jgi:23S rRNA pseudouridine2605 synthase
VRERKFAPRYLKAAHQTQGFEGKPKLAANEAQLKAANKAASGKDLVKPNANLHQDHLKVVFKKREGGFKEISTSFGDRPAHRPDDLANQQDAPKPCAAVKMALLNQAKLKMTD